jgi:hypothetical protein
MNNPKYKKKYIKYIFKNNNIFGGDIPKISTHFILELIPNKHEHTKTGILNFLSKNKFTTDLISREKYSSYDLENLSDLVVFKENNNIKEIYFLEDLQNVIDAQWYKNPGKILNYDYEIFSDEIKQKIKIPVFDIIGFNLYENNLRMINDFNYLKYFMPALCLLVEIPKANNRYKYFCETPSSRCNDNSEIDNLLINAEKNIIMYSSQLINSAKELNFEICSNNFIHLLKTKVGPYDISNENPFVKEYGIGENTSFYGFYANTSSLLNGFKIDKNIKRCSNIGDFMFYVGGLLVCLVKYFFSISGNEFIEQNFNHIFNCIKEYLESILFSTLDGLAVYRHFKIIGNHLNREFGRNLIIFNCFQNSERCSRGILQYECNLKKQIIIITDSDEHGMISPEISEKIFNMVDNFCS